MPNHQDIEQAQKHMDEYLHDLKTIVNIDSGTYTKKGIDRVSAYLQNRFQTLGFSTRYDKQEQYGDHLIATHTGQSRRGPHVSIPSRLPHRAPGLNPKACLCNPM